MTTVEKVSTGKMASNSMVLLFLAVGIFYFMNKKKSSPSAATETPKPETVEKKVDVEPQPEAKPVQQKMPTLEPPPESSGLVNLKSVDGSDFLQFQVQEAR